MDLALWGSKVVFAFLLHICNKRKRQQGWVDIRLLLVVNYVHLLVLCSCHHQAMLFAALSNVEALQICIQTWVQDVRKG